MTRTNPTAKDAETAGLPKVNAGERQELGILFVDLVDSSVFASTLSLEAYAEYVDEFKQVVLAQCRHFFEDYLQGKYREWQDYAASIVGDELVVFLRTGRPGNDVYLLTLLAVLLKAAWLGASFNRARIDRDMPPSEIAAGINHGSVWAVWQDNRFAFTGYSINLAKRIESRSRTGERYRILVSDRAVKLISLKVRNLLFGSRQLFEAKGILGSVGFHELAYTFINPTDRLCPSLSPGLKEILSRAMQASTHDSWIHDFIQNWSEAEANAVTDSSFAIARQILSHEPGQPVALYFLAQGLRERERWEDARVALVRLIREWPYFGDGHWEFGKVAKHLGEERVARDAFRQAHLLGVEEALAELTAGDDRAQEAPDPTVPVLTERAIADILPSRGTQ